MPEKRPIPVVGGNHPDFITRAEYHLLEDQALSGRNPILITGPYGSGKTALVQRFVDKHTKRGVRWLVAANAPSGTGVLSQVLLDASREKVRTLIIDEAESLRGHQVAELHEYLNGRPTVQVIVLSANESTLHVLRTLKNSSSIELSSLTYSEFLEFFHRIAPLDTTFPDSTLVAFYESTRGLPRLLSAGLGALRAGFITNPQDLVASFSDFSSPGLVGPDGRPLRKNSHDERRIIVEVSTANAEVLKLLNKQPDLLWQIAPRQFEELVADILEKQGYEVDLTPASGDGGFDMYAAKKDGLGKFLYLVECKRYTPPNKVGVEIVRAVNGVVQAKQATAGAIVTTSHFTRGAQEFQREQEHRMSLHDYIVLRQWITNYATSSPAAD